MPFVPGHEVVGRRCSTTARTCPRAPAWCIDPVLACAARGVEPCEQCAEGRTNLCDRITVGHVAPGLQTGFCSDTGGGWGEQMMAHRSQLHPVPGRAARRAGRAGRAAGLRRPAGPAGRVPDGGARAGLRSRRRRPVRHAGAARADRRRRITVVAKHARQRELARAVRRHRRRRARRGDARRCAAPPGRSPSMPEFSAPYLLGGVDVAVDAVGSKPLAGDRAALHAGRRPGGAVRHAAPAPTCRPRGSASSRWPAPTRPPGEDPDGRSAFDIAAELAPRDAVAARQDVATTRCTAGARRSTTPSRPAGSAPSRSASIPP